MAWPRSQAERMRSTSRAWARMHSGVAAGQPAIDPGDGAAPVAQQIEGDDGGDDDEREDVEQGEAAADQAGEGAGHEAEHGAGLAADEVAQLFVDVFGAEPLLQVGDDARRPRSGCRRRRRARG